MPVSAGKAKVGAPAACHSPHEPLGLGGFSLLSPLCLPQRPPQTLCLWLTKHSLQNSGILLCTHPVSCLDAFAGYDPARLFFWQSSAHGCASSLPCRLCTMQQEPMHARKTLVTRLCRLHCGQAL